MNENHIEVKFAEPVPARVLIEEDLYALKTLSDLVTHYAKEQPGDPVHFNDITRAAFLSLAKTINDKVKERTVDYSGERYIIMAKGRRKLTLDFKREPDIYIGSDYGLNFIEACRNYFLFSPLRNGYNQRKNTFYRRLLFALPVKDIYNYESGIKQTERGYATWFKISNQTFTLADVETNGEALFGCKILNKIFENLLTIKITKP